MHNKIIILFMTLLSTLLHSMENNSLQLLEIPKELLTKIIACSDSTGKEQFRQTCKTLQRISSINNWDMYAYNPLVLSLNKTKDILLLMADQKQEAAINNLLNHNIDFSNEPFEFYLQLSNKYLHIAELLIQHSAIDINESTSLNASYLYLAAQEGNKQHVQLLLKHPKVNVNCTYKQKFTPIFIAAQKGHLDIVKLLANHNDCILDGLNPKGCTPLYVACQEGHNEIVNLLLTQKVSTPKTFRIGFTPLFIAAHNGHVLVIKTLLNHNPEQIDQSDNEGATPLYVAAQNGHAEAVKILCQYGANKNSYYLNDYPPFYIAAQNGHIKVIKILLCYPEIDINRITPHGTALHIATKNGHAKVVNLLLKHADTDTMLPNVNPNIINNDAKTPLDIAYENNNAKIINLLIQHGAKTATELK